MTEVICPFCGCEAKGKIYTCPCYIFVKPTTGRERDKREWQNKKRGRVFRYLRIQVWTYVEQRVICKSCKKREKAESAKRSDIAAWKAYMKANPRYFKSLFHTPIQRAAADVFGLLK